MPKCTVSFPRHIINIFSKLEYISLQEKVRLRWEGPPLFLPRVHFVYNTCLQTDLKWEASFSHNALHRCSRAARCSGTFDCLASCRKKKTPVIRINSLFIWVDQCQRRRKEEETEREERGEKKVGKEGAEGGERREEERLLHLWSAAVHLKLCLMHLDSKN